VQYFHEGSFVTADKLEILNDAQYAACSFAAGELLIPATDVAMTSYKNFIAPQNNLLQ
jgi:hypothetical protein